MFGALFSSLVPPNERSRIRSRVSYRHLASYVDRVLKGADPATMPVELPTTFELVVNLKTARALGIKIPQVVLLRADRIIE